MTKELKSLQLSLFEAQIGTEFRIHFKDQDQNDQVYVLELLEAVGIGDKERDIDAHGRESFSLIFASEDTERYLNQQVYPLEHDDLGILHLFLVPIGIKDAMMRYEVVFT